MPAGKPAALSPLLLVIALALAAVIAFKLYHHIGRAGQWRQAAPAQSLEGFAKLDDGDSLKIQRQRVRLVGIDAPELRQFCEKDGADYACGAAATEHLRALIAGRPVRCDWVEKDKYNRVLGHCFAGETDLNRSMAADGWAVDYSAPSNYNNNYKREERAAKAAKIGIWQGRFERPRIWRKRHPRSDAPSPVMRLSSRP